VRTRIIYKLCNKLKKKLQQVINKSQ